MQPASYELFDSVQESLPKIHHCGALAAHTVTTPLFCERLQGSITRLLLLMPLAFEPLGDAGLLSFCRLRPQLHGS